MVSLEARINDLQKQVLKNKITSINGGELREGSGGTGIDIPQTFVLGKITVATIQGSSYIWKYTVVPVVVDGIGDVNIAGQASYALNLTELNNPSDGTGVHGNGVDNSVAGWPAGYEIQPCPVNTIVMLWPIQSITGIRYVFSYANGVDGTC